MTLQKKRYAALEYFENKKLNEVDDEPPIDKDLDVFEIDGQKYITIYDPCLKIYRVVHFKYGMNFRKSKKRNHPVLIHSHSHSFDSKHTSIKELSNHNLFAPQRDNLNCEILDELENS